jgi:SNF2 family DNA or RNA helicase
LNEIFLRRTKDILSNELPEKEERIVFCEPSQLQKELYQNILELPDFVLLKHSQAPCDCGVNRKVRMKQRYNDSRQRSTNLIFDHQFFLEYKQLRTDEEKIRYSRLHKKDIVKRGQCCYQYPLDKNGNIDSRAILWRQRHDDKKDGCANCPNCIFFSAFHVVHKLTSHVALLQLDASYHPEQFPLGSKKRENAEKALDRAKTFFPAHLLSRIPGGYIRSSSIMDNHFVLSGKMRELHKLLVAIRKQFGRVLLFSFSTQMLDLIELYMKSHGHTFLRMDGQTNVKTRTELVNRFKKDPNIFAFLLSTKAMGVGLNLVEANYVIIYDVDWNPVSAKLMTREKIYVAIRSFFIFFFLSSRAMTAKHRVSTTVFSYQQILARVTRSYL